ncbi:MAG: hypothetical protein AAFY20_17910 [Cyanobacteria bacterium J06639_14]
MKLNSWMQNNDLSAIHASGNGDEHRTFLRVSRLITANKKGTYDVRPYLMAQRRR